MSKIEKNQPDAPEGEEQSQHPESLAADSYAEPAMDLDHEDSDAIDELLAANTIERETSEEIQKRDAIHDILDDVFSKDVNPDDEDIVDGLPKRIHRMLNKRMPREAIQNIQSTTMFLDDDGNIQVVKDHLQRVDSIVIDYLANKIFGSRLNMKIVDHKIVREGTATRRVNNKEYDEYVCSGFAKVRISIRLEGGGYWKMEGVGLSEWAAPLQGGSEEIRRARRVGYIGCVTLARKQALMGFGNVFQCVRDNDGLIDRIKESQRTKIAARKAEEADLKSLEDSVERKNASSKKPAISIDPVLKSAESEKAKSLGKLEKKAPGSKPRQKAVPANDAGQVPAKVSDNAAKPASTNSGHDTSGNSGTGTNSGTPTNSSTGGKSAGGEPNALPFSLYKADGSHRGNLKGAAIFAQEIAKMLLKAKTEETVAAILQHNKAGIDLLIRDPKFGAYADQVRGATEATRTLIAETAQRKAKAAEKKAAKEAAARRKQAQAYADASADAAVRDVVAAPPAKEPAAVEMVEDPAGFGQVPARILGQPASSAGTVEDKAAGESGALGSVGTGYHPELVPPLKDETGEMFNRQAFGQSALEAIQNAPTLADLDILEARIESHLAETPQVLATFIRKEIEKKRARL